MEVGINLENPFLYNEKIIKYLLLILVILTIIIAFIFFYKKYYKQIKKLIVKKGKKHNQDYYLQKLLGIKRKYANGKISNRKVCILISSLVRHFVYDKTDILVQNYSLEEIKKLNMPDLANLIEKIYNPEFSKYSNDDINGNHKGEWTATAAQFQQPYVFKTLFSHEPITFKDMCEIKEVKGALYLDLNEGLGEGEHNYHFVGKVGEFCPMQPGCGAGELLRFADDKYSAAVGTKGYRWLESDMVKSEGIEDMIDKSYYTKLVDAAVKDISKYCDFEWFVAND